jgi:hypothetical protein
MINKIILSILIILFSISINANIIIKEHSTRHTCAKRSFAINDLENRLDFTRKAFSVTSDNKIIELYTNKYKGNWLIMITGTDKITCGLIGGQQEFIFE